MDIDNTSTKIEENETKNQKLEETKTVSNGEKHEEGEEKTVAKIEETKSGNNKMDIEETKSVNNGEKHENESKGNKDEKDRKGRDRDGHRDRGRYKNDNKDRRDRHRPRSRGRYRKSPDRNKPSDRRDKSKSKDRRDRTERKRSRSPNQKKRSPPPPRDNRKRTYSESGLEKENKFSNKRRKSNEKTDIKYEEVSQIEDTNNLKKVVTDINQKKNMVQLSEYDKQIKILEDNEGRSRKLHWSEKKLKDMNSKDWRIFKEEFYIITKGGKIPNPIRNNWDESGLDSWILEKIKTAGYDKPTPIQMQAIPIGIQKRDFMGIAETGSGKTAAFVIPMLLEVERLLGSDSKKMVEGNQPFCLILAPARELALQIEKTVRLLANKARVVSLIGGYSKLEQGMEVNTGCDVVVATPGRLIDCIESGYFSLDRCIFYILDEADRMTEEFEDYVINILELSETREQRVMMMFSATMPPAVERISKKYLRNPAYIYIGEQGLAVKNITQVVEFIPIGMNKEQEDNYKKGKLQKILREGPKPPIIIFTNKKQRCDILKKYLSSLGFRAVALHSKKSQQGRTNALEDFKEGKFEILVATDVASRGLHVNGVTHVINFDMPPSIVTYTHRIGRTGRMGLKGQSTSFLTSDDGDIMSDLKEVLVKTGNKVPSELSNHPRVKGMRNVF